MLKLQHLFYLHDARGRSETKHSIIFRTIFFTREKKKNWNHIVRTQENCRTHQLARNKKTNYNNNNNK